MKPPATLRLLTSAFILIFKTRLQINDNSIKIKKPLGKRSQRLISNFGNPAVMAFQL